jgi:uncharacterized cupredoxin-like copper-binding protein
MTTNPRIRNSIVLALAAFLAFTVAACGGGGDSSSSSTAATATTSTAATGGGSGDSVDVSLGEWFVRPSVDSIAPGNVRFTVTNDGSVEHEFVVIKTDTPADQLPLTGGDVNEEAAGKSPGEIPEFAPGTTKSTTLKLTPGHYVFICNVAGHYNNGQRTDFTVTG